jgi:hypothetical protein
MVRGRMPGQAVKGEPHPLSGSKTDSRRDCIGPFPSRPSVCKLTRLAGSVAAHEKRTSEPIEQINVAGRIAIGDGHALIESSDSE